MNFDKNSLRLYIITDRTWLLDNKLKDQVEESIKAGATFVQLREKDITFDEFVSIAKEIKEVTDRYNVPFVINDNVDVALAVDADGVHVGQSDEELASARTRLGNDKIIGVSAGTIEEAISAEKGGADYIGVGAVFSTSTKLDADSIPMDKLKEICASVNIPVVAIGGITPTNILELKGSGIYGISVISAIFAQKNITKATEELNKLTKELMK